VKSIDSNEKYTALVVLPDEFGTKSLDGLGEIGRIRPFLLTR